MIKNDLRNLLLILKEFSPDELLFMRADGFDL